MYTQFDRIISPLCISLIQSGIDFERKVTDKEEKESQPNLNVSPLSLQENDYFLLFNRYKVRVQIRSPPNVKRFNTRGRVDDEKVVPAIVFVYLLPEGIN